MFITLRVQNSCVQPAAMADPPSVIRIGDEKYMTYKCGRGKEENNNWVNFETDAHVAGG